MSFPFLADNIGRSSNSFLADRNWKSSSETDKSSVTCFRMQLTAEMRELGFWQSLSPILSVLFWPTLLCSPSHFCLSLTHTYSRCRWIPEFCSSVRWLLHRSREGYVHLSNCLLKLTHSVRLYLTGEAVWECGILVSRALISRLWEVWFNFILSIAQPLPNRKMHPIYTIMKNEGTAEHSKLNAFWFLFFSKMCSHAIKFLFHALLSI